MNKMSKEITIVALIMNIFKTCKPYSIWLVGSNAHTFLQFITMEKNLIWSDDIDFAGHFEQTEHCKVKRGLFGNIHTFTSTIKYINIDFTSFEGNNLFSDILSRGCSNSVVGFDGEKIVVMVNENNGIVPKFAENNKLEWTALQVSTKGMDRMIHFWSKKNVH